MPILVHIPPGTPYPNLDRDRRTGSISCARDDLAPVFEASPGLQDILLADEEAFVAFLVQWYLQARKEGQTSLVMEQVLAESEAGVGRTAAQVQTSPARLQ